MFGALGALAALEVRRRTGRGQVVDAAIYESVLGVTEALVTQWQATGVVRQRTGATLPGIAPSNVYPARDGQVLIAANQDSVFRRLVQAMDMPELASDPRFADHQARGRNMAEIDGIIAEWAQRFDSADLLALLTEAGIPAGLVYEPKDMLDDPQFVARGAIAVVEDERRGELAMPAVVPKLSETPGEIRWTGRPLGADTDAVLTDLLGLTAEQLDELRSKGVLGRAPDGAKEGSR
jgi:crotonobetainyl-CoA:carnitine CoA-transferase CaiB-like acyl-CoA transferase